MKTCDRCGAPESAEERGNGCANWCPTCREKLADLGARTVEVLNAREEDLGLGRDWSATAKEAITDILLAARLLGLCEPELGGDGPPPYDAATATGMYDRDF